jgi:glycerol-3-phosphate dehydrogenase (NAD(P)+)
MDTQLPSVAVIGMGNLGTSLAHWMAHNAEVVCWAHSEETVREINEQHTNHKYLDNYDLHPNLRATSNIHEALNNAQIVFLTLPARHICPILHDATEQIKQAKLIVNTAKGMDIEHGMPMYDSITHRMEGSVEVIQLAGPMLANEFVRGTKTIGILTRPHRISREVIRNLYNNTPLEFVYTTDIQGVVWAALLKNIYAIGWGMLEVISGDNMNLKGIFMTKAFEEMMVVARKEGAFTDTLFGLAGLGDFVATALSKNSHNHDYGTDFARGLINEDYRLPEGYFSLQGLFNRYQQSFAEYPLLETLYKIIFENLPINALIDQIVV